MRADIETDEAYSAQRVDEIVVASVIKHGMIAEDVAQGPRVKKDLRTACMEESFTSQFTWITGNGTGSNL